jgi:rhamnogalacturonyl hydrolase YesR
MKQLLTLIVFSVIFFISCKQKEESMTQLTERVMTLAKSQSLAMAKKLENEEGRMPRNYNPHTDKFESSNTQWWCSGFFPGVLWFIYEYSGDSTMNNWADFYTLRVEPEKHNTYDHDIGFQMYCSFGTGLRLTGSDYYKDVVKISGQSALERYNPHIGLIKSWSWDNDGKWQYPVIIDNMMNLELLMWNFKETGDSAFLNVAVSHSDKTIEHHYRDDFSCYHLVSYDTLTGEPHLKKTVQGDFDESVWARGNAWGLYGYTMMYRETGLKRYLEHAIGIADFLVNHPNLPEDKIPYWDFLASDIPNSLRDASAAAVMASALIELSTLIEDNVKKEKYLNTAETQLRTLATPEYLAESGTNGHFILKRSVGHLHADSEVDVALTYADYYFLEALLRYNNVLKK